jgi:hypothetical protein
MFVHPLMADTDLSVAVTWLGFVSWHLVPIMLMSLAIAFGYAARNPENAALAVFACAMSAAVSILCIAVGISGSSVLFTLPAPPSFWRRLAFGNRRRSRKTEEVVSVARGEDGGSLSIFPRETLFLSPCL